MTIEYFLNTTDDMTRLSDLFVMPGCRVRLMGSVVTVECDADDQERAHALVSQYVEALREAGFFIPRVLTLQEFSSLPPWASSTTPGPRASLQDLELSRERVGRARRAVVSPAHPRLSQCYDYLEQARHDAKHALYHLYKLVETVESHFGGEQRAIRSLDARTLIKSLKGDANKHQHDQRHAPKEPSSRQGLDDNAVAAQIDSARQLLARFEAAVMSGHRPKYEA